MNLKNDIKTLADSMDADPILIKEFGLMSNQKFINSVFAPTMIIEGILLAIYTHLGEKLDLQRHRNTNSNLLNFRRIILGKFPEASKSLPPELIDHAERISYLSRNPPFSGPLDATTIQLANKLLHYLRAALAFVVADCETMADAVEVGLYGFENLKIISEYLNSLSIK
jgi:hypothetical protein